jgi:hypothetical protein
LAIKFRTRLLLPVIILSLLGAGCTTLKNARDKTTIPSVTDSVPETVETTTKPQETNTNPTEASGNNNEPSANDSYILPDSHTKKLDEAAVKSLKPELLPFARNEIYARRGYVFTKDEYKNYFATKSWYKPNPNFREGDLSDIEKYNVDLIKSYEAPSSSKPAAPTSLINTYKAEVTVSVDLNSDGVKEKITYKPDKSQLLINSKAITFNFDAPAKSFAIADIDTKDKFKEVLLSDYGPSSDYRTEYYYWDGTNIIKMGETEDMFESGLGINGSGRIIAETRGKILQTWFFNKTFKLSSQHKVTEVLQDLYTTNSDVSLKMQLKLYKNKGDASPSIVVNKGEKIKIIGTDDKAWCLLKTANGTQGWIAVYNNSTIRNNGLEASDVFEGLCYAD